MNPLVSNCLTQIEQMLLSRINGIGDLLDWKPRKRRGEFTHSEARISTHASVKQNNTFADAGTQDSDTFLLLGTVIGQIAQLIHQLRIPNTTFFILVTDGHVGGIESRAESGSMHLAHIGAQFMQGCANLECVIDPSERIDRVGADFLANEIAGDYDHDEARQKASKAHICLEKMSQACCAFCE
ncbi:MAG: hypothetical protein ABIO49_14005 [Dokdonella sp.]